MPSRLEGTFSFPGPIYIGSGTIPPSCVSDANVAGDAAIAATKIEQQYPIRYTQDDGTDVAAAIVPVYTVRGVSATIVEVDVVCIDAPEGGDKEFTVDVGKCNAGSPAPATILTGVVEYDVDTPDCTVLEGTIDTAALAAGDTLVVTVAVSGSSGNQGQGLVVTVTIREDAE